LSNNDTEYWFCVSVSQLLWYLYYICCIRGVARNLLRGQKRESGGRKSPSGVQEQCPGEVWERSPQKPETHANFQLYDEGAWGHAPMSPGYANGCIVLTLNILVQL